MSAVPFSLPSGGSVALVARPSARTLCFSAFRFGGLRSVSLVTSGLGRVSVRFASRAAAVRFGRRWGVPVACFGSIRGCSVVCRAFSLPGGVLCSLPVPVSGGLRGLLAALAAWGVF